MRSAYNVRMRVRVLYFAACRQAAGTGEEEVDLPAPPTVAGLWSALLARHPSLAGWEGKAKIAVDEELAGPDAPLRGGETVAVLPPLSGGMPEAALVDGPVSAAELAGALSRQGGGAVATFEGIVRPREGDRAIAGLRYEVYETMALRKLQEVAREAMERFRLIDVRIAHRRGFVPAGEAAVAIAVAAERREAAFEACRFAIERLKEIVPIWKAVGAGEAP